MVTSRAISAQSIPALGLKSASGSAAITSAIHCPDNGCDEPVDRRIRHADDIEAAAVGHVYRVAVALGGDLLARQWKHREHAALPADVSQPRIRDCDLTTD